MERTTKWMMIGMIATLVSLAVGLTCLIVTKFNNLAVAIMFAVVVAASIVIAIFLWRDLVKARVKTEEKEEESK